MPLFSRRCLAVFVGVILITVCLPRLPRAAPAQENPETVVEQQNSSTTVESMRTALVDRLVARGAQANQARAAIAQLNDADVRTLYKHPNMLHPAGDVSEGALILICVGAVIVVLLIVIAA